MTLANILSSILPSASTVAVCVDGTQTALITFESCNDFVNLMIDGAMSLFEETQLSNTQQIASQRVYVQRFNAPYREVLAYAAVAAGNGVELLSEADF